MEREACVCDHGFERSDLCAEIIIIIIIIIIMIYYTYKSTIYDSYHLTNYTNHFNIIAITCYAVKFFSSANACSGR